MKPRTLYLLLAAGALALIWLASISGLADKFFASDIYANLYYILFGAGVVLLICGAVLRATRKSQGLANGLMLGGAAVCGGVYLLIQFTFKL
jgi:hypothetical protein